MREMSVNEIVGVYLVMAGKRSADGWLGEEKGKERKRHPPFMDHLLRTDHFSCLALFFPKHRPRIHIFYLLSHSPTPMSGVCLSVWCHIPHSTWPKCLEISLFSLQWWGYSIAHASCRLGSTKIARLITHLVFDIGCSKNKKRCAQSKETRREWWVHRDGCVPLHHLSVLKSYRIF